MFRYQWRLWLLLVSCLFFICYTQLQAFPSTEDFKSIDCGKQEVHTDQQTNILYLPDASYIATGDIANVSNEFYHENYGELARDLRYFPKGKRNCYTIAVNQSYRKFLVRAWFQYGNYDGFQTPPTFDLYLGPNKWRTVNAVNSSYWQYHEVITFVEAGRKLLVCLVNTNSGVPFVSGLEVRPLDRIMYEPVDENRSLMLFKRLDVKGDADSNEQVRYRDDPYDRIWASYSKAANWSALSTRDAIIQPDESYFAPNKVLQTAAYPTNSSFAFCWGVRNESSHLFFAYIYIVELKTQPSRVKDIKFEPKELRNVNLTPNIVKVVSWPDPALQVNKSEIEFVPFPGSPLGPIISAVEVFMVMNITIQGSDKQDVDAINDVKDKLNVKKDDWSGDPCLPNNLSWSGLFCNYAIANPKITVLNLSSSALTGELPESLRNLTSLEYLILSNNSLTGRIPDFLANLPLKALDLSSNNFKGTIPRSLRDKSSNFRFGNNPDLCVTSDWRHCKRTAVKLALVVTSCVASLLVVVLLVLLFIRIQKRRKTAAAVGYVVQRLQFGIGTEASSVSEYMMDFNPESRQFTFAELLKITNEFSKVIGKGGFGFVYHGALDNGMEVAVKQLSHSSSQGPREFIKEVQLLSRIHHRNLVSLIGFCDDEQHLALVYEYMSNGSLRDHLSGKSSQLSSWRERLRIATDVCQGLGYLHKGCKPSIIHRDIKTSNILLNHNMEAKLADFGLSKIFHNDSIVDHHSHVSTSVMGTPGYLDPEYSSTNQLTEKSDVYSFGIVLLELVTGLEAIIRQDYHVHIVQYVEPLLQKGDISVVVDKKLQGGYDINSIWKATEIALSCTCNESFNRPTITVVLTQLKDCLQLEDQGKISSTTFDNSSNTDLDTPPLNDSLIGYPRPR